MSEISWLMALLAILGTILNLKRRWEGFLLWIVSNSFWFIHNMQIGEYQQASLSCLYTFLAVAGIREWLVNRSDL